MSEKRNLSVLIVPRSGGVVAGGDLWEPVRIVDAAGDPVTAVATFVKDLQASGPFGIDAALLCDGPPALVPVPLDYRGPMGSGNPKQRPATSADGSLFPQAATRRLHHPVDEQRAKPGDRQVPPRAHVRDHDPCALGDRPAGFLRLPPRCGTGLMVNPVPLSRDRRGGRANAHHNPMEPYRNDRVGLYRPRVARRIPRCIPDALFNQVFAELGSHRDRALVALWVSTAARALRTARGAL